MTRSEQKVKDLELEIKRLKSALSELTLLNEIAIAAGKSTNIDDMLNMILQKCILAIGAEQGSVLLVPENKSDPLKTYIRQDDFSTLKHSYHIGTEITGWVLINQKPLIIEDLKKDKRFSKSADEEKDIRSIICVPIWFEGLIIGVMMMINNKKKKYYDNEDLTLLSIISVQIGQMIKNLQYQKEVYEKEKTADIAILQAENLQELDKIKSVFFENISHEFRTPLTLILGPVKKMLSEENSAKYKKEFTRVIKNAERLLNLINQILDLSKIETGNYKLSICNGDVAAFINSVAKSFYPAAEQKNIEYSLISKPENIPGYFDPDKLEKILTNLLSNAFKFTRDGGSISVEVTGKFEKEVEIKIRDTGIGIPQDQIEKIFDRFYQVNRLSEEDTPGTGIGLALVKELIELHHGKISVDSTEGKGSQFMFTIPLAKENYVSVNITGSSFDLTEYKLENYKLPLESEPSNGNIDRIYQDKEQIILVVEDNTDVRNFITENLAKNFRVLESGDGEEGWENALVSIPDLIISDIRMPKLDGIDLCKKLKFDERTSHIPVILLTAKAEEHDKLKGLNVGADDYITKPFDYNELNARINNLILQRTKLRKKFSSQITLQPKDISITSADERFLNKVMDLIENNISDSSLNVKKLSDEIGMSRVQLFRKLKALTDQSVVDFIRSMRLKRALKLLENSSGNISEIAYNVGFNNPAYFSECFRKQFGKLPSEYNKISHTT